MAGHHGGKEEGEGGQVVEERPGVSGRQHEVDRLEDVGGVCGVVVQAGVVSALRGPNERAAAAQDLQNQNTTRNVSAASMTARGTLWPESESASRCKTAGPRSRDCGAYGPLSRLLAAAALDRPNSKPTAHPRRAGLVAIAYASFAGHACVHWQRVLLLPCCVVLLPCCVELCSVVQCAYWIILSRLCTP